MVANLAQTYMEIVFPLRRRRCEARELNFHQINLRLTLLCTMCSDFQGEAVEFTTRNLGPGSMFLGEAVTEAIRLAFRRAMGVERAGLRMRCFRSKQLGNALEGRARSSPTLGRRHFLMQRTWWFCAGANAQRGE